MSWNILCDDYDMSLNLESGCIMLSKLGKLLDHINLITNYHK